ncbi:PEPxxWA-CTERM sorting domain-containing protein [Sandarakinorhabdus sp. DWP1-3-1]|uniref:PEPxxWA-CTERM sorting domain-containing protein n=1 Tax=Sandarakinorhabdus sp. DWP1-3-1 TaxID=2804627 RepID=UPI003CF38BAF
MKINLLAAVAAMAIAAPALAANVVTNGSFETGDFSGWTQFGNTDFTFVTPDPFLGGPTDGTFHAAFGPVGSAGGISQTFASAGNYTVSFDLGNESGGFNSVDFGGITLLSSVASGVYASYSFNVTVGANSTLSFSFQNDPSFYVLDNVVVDFGGAVPEPASWAMLIAGFGLTGAAMRRRRVARAA